MQSFSHHTLRELYQSYFEGKQHRRVASSGLIPRGDKTLLFSNAGMNQFKDYFLGARQAPYACATSCQKCMRAGGKHNDLENVGYSTRHHTFFEMLGNFSFGDYFKRKAIDYACEFVFHHLKLPFERIYISVFNQDDEAMRLWLESGVPEERIFRFGEKDNFWSMGDTGPCGPCSELFYDLGDAFGPASPENDKRYFEFWNLVFMQYNRDQAGKLHPLQNKNIDTGMGLERTLSILEGVDSNFDTSLFQPIMRRLEETFSCRYQGDDSLPAIAFRVVADHCRAIAFLIADGQLPTNFSRGYVLRRIIRRAHRYGAILSIDRPFLAEILEVVIREMSPFYPELLENRSLILQVGTREEENFMRTLSKGVQRVQEVIQAALADSEPAISGPSAFKLYDTYGIPYDIIMDMAKDYGLQVDEPGFLEAMNQQRAKARSARDDSAGRDLPAPAQGVATRFIGYDALRHVTTVAAILQDNHWVQEAAGPCYVVCDATPFYGEKGGQVGDSGLMVLRDGSGRYAIEQTVYLSEEIIGHYVREPKQGIRVGQPVILDVDTGARRATERNHTATHLLHYALREVLGSHVKQAGSLVEPGRLRFDFNYYEALTPEQLLEIETMVQQAVLHDHPVTEESMSYRQAVENGAIALFTEKYGDTVRVIRIGDFSIELCGGTHVRRTGEIGVFKIISESAIASGVRRIEAMTGMALFQQLRALFNQEKIIKQRYIKQDTPLLAYVEQLNQDLKAKQKALTALQLKWLNLKMDSLVARRKAVRDVGTIKARFADIDKAVLRNLMDNIKSKTEKTAIFLVSDGRKPVYICGLTQDLKDRLHARDLLNTMLAPVKGRGGGRWDLAQGGSRSPEDIGKVMAAFETVVEGEL